MTKMNSLNNHNHVNSEDKNKANRMKLAALISGGVKHDDVNDNAEEPSCSCFLIHPTSGGTIMTAKKQRDPNVGTAPPTATATFHSSSIRGSYTLQDISKAYLQGTNQEFYDDVDPDFVDFVFARNIEDDAMLYRRKRCVSQRK